MTDLHKVYLSLGSNLGDSEKNILKAIELIDKNVGRVVGRSSLIETRPWGFSSSNNFINAAVCCETNLSPRRLLQTTQGIERFMGRQEKSHDGEYKDRVIDIDILLYDELKVDEPDLKIPHPLMWKRDFVVKPLSEIYKRC